MSRIAVLDDYQGVAFEHGDWSSLQAEHEVVAFHQHLGNEEQVAEALQNMDVVCVMRERTPFPRSQLERLPNLKLLITSGAKNGAIDMAAARELGITVCGTRSPGHAASELAFGLILALARQITEEDRQMRSGGWQTTVGSDLRGQTLGILGLGRHGSNLARFGQAFGMRVIAWSQNLTRERCDELGVEYAEKESFFRESDFITIHLKVGQRNRGLVGSDEFSLMKPSAYIVNTSRGPIIQETALLDALQNGTIAGAGIDVYDNEPLPRDHPLRNAPRTVLTSHVGYVTRQTYDVFYSETVECIEAFLADKPVRVLNSE
ncbi:MAG: D-2-hydroxyacid dehydrogenase family protein [Sedimenticola sp.]